MLGMSVSAGHGLCGPLYRVDQVPEQYHEHFIIRGYRRPKSSFTQCILSLFDATNETLNFWTHFLPSLYFIWIVIQFSSTMDFQHDPYSWPLLCYLFTCCAFPMASAVAHLFNVMSENVRHVCFFLDYAALSLFSIGCAIVYRAYSFPSVMLSADDSSFLGWYRDNYVPMSIFNSFICTTMSCQSRFMKPSPLRKVMRLGSFAFPYLYDIIPIIIRLSVGQPSSLSSLEGLDGDANLLSGDYYHKRQFIFAFLSAFLYASHLPERILPGFFDIVGHSHQLFHVATILAVMDQLQSIVLDVQERKEFLLSSHWIFHSPNKSLGIVAFVFVANCIILLFFIFKLFHAKSNQLNQKST